MVTWKVCLPGWPGNTALTGHLTWQTQTRPVAACMCCAQASAGTADLGRQVTYQVRFCALPAWLLDPAVLQHEDQDWLTLITCQSYDEAAATYRWRVVVRAERVEPTQPAVR